jgi:COMPASS component SPP1
MQLPPPPLPPIQRQYDLVPPNVPTGSLNEQSIEGNKLPAMRSVDVQLPTPEVDRSNITTSVPIVADVADVSQDEIMEDARLSGYRVPEQEIAALGLAALDGAQDEEKPEVKTEAQTVPDVKAVPAVKSGSRPHKAPGSKPSEGSSDKRFLCYICIKLFTRRRSVRDHIKKIHDDDNFDTARAIEVTVDPETGESIIPLAELIKTLPPPSNAQQTPTNASQAAPQATSHPASRASSVDTTTFSTPAPVAGKKRPAPEPPSVPTMAAKKKGTAKPKPLNTATKKTKVELDTIAEANSTLRSPSSTPISSRASKTPAPPKTKKQSSMSLASSPVPSQRVSIEPETDEDAEPEAEGSQAFSPAAHEAEAPTPSTTSEVFCICRKGDNHTWMIGCDGGCEDWFHGKCVHIQERDGDLIDKYICPNCEEKGVGQTTWKRMCRRKECRRPARVLAEPPSKYCSDDCKKRFWVGMVVKSDPNAIVSEDGLMIIGSRVDANHRDNKKKKRRKPQDDEEYNETTNNEEGESEYEENGANLSPSRKKKKLLTPIKNRRNDYAEEDDSEFDDEPPLPTRGGSLTVGDIKMMLNQAKTVEEIRKLGQKPPTPPYTSDADLDFQNKNPDTKMVDGLPDPKQEEQKPFPYTPHELRHLDLLAAKKRDLTVQLSVIADQEKFLEMVKERSARIVEEMEFGSKSKKSVCGFDKRLAWGKEEFVEWRDSAAGQTALATGQVGDPEPEEDDVKVENGDADGMMVDGIANPRTNNGDEDGDDDEDSKPKGPTSMKGVCVRMKCARHRDWRRLVASEYKFEEENVHRQIRKVEKEMIDVRERAGLRVLGAL